MWETGYEGGVAFGMKNGSRLFAKGENCSGRWDVGGNSTEDHSLVAEVKAIEKAQR